MNQNMTTTKLDTICDICRCKGQRFFHNVWYENQIQRICTSCVLLNLFEFYCPTCFAVHDSPSPDMTCCEKCKSHSHPRCFPSDSSGLGAPSLCLTCKNPSRVIFRLRDSKKKWNDGNLMLMDKNASTLLLTATKISTTLMRKRVDELKNFVVRKAEEMVVIEPKAKGLVDTVLESTGY